MRAPLDMSFQTNQVYRRSEHARNRSDSATSGSGGFITCIPPQGRYRQHAAAARPKGEPLMSRTYMPDDLCRLVDRTNLHADASKPTWSNYATRRSITASRWRPSPRPDCASTSISSPAPVSTQVSPSPSRRSRSPSPPRCSRPATPSSCSPSHEFVPLQHRFPGKWSENWFEAGRTRRGERKGARECRTPRRAYAVW